jgi:hypothetical protein
MTTDDLRKPSPKPRADKAPDEAAKCNVPSCQHRGDDLTRGLCDPHWSTHRGLADPEPTEPKEFGQVPHPEVAIP